MANESSKEKAYDMLGISKYDPWYKVLNISRNSSLDKITKRYNNLRAKYENSNDAIDEKILEILDNSYEDVICQFNFKTDDEIKEDVYGALEVTSNASWFEILNVNNNSTKEQINSIANSLKNKYNDKLHSTDSEYLQKLYKAVQETISEAAEEGIKEISKPKAKLNEVERKTYKGHKTKYYKEYMELDKLGGLNFLAKELETKTTTQITKELFNLNSGSLITQYCKFNNTTVSKIRSESKIHLGKTKDISHSKFKKCPKCGKQVNEVRNHCPHCKHDFTNKPKTSKKKTITQNNTKTRTKTKHEKTCPHCGQKFYSKNIKKCTKCGYNFEHGIMQKKETPTPKFKRCPTCGELVRENKYICPKCKHNFKTDNNTKPKTPTTRKPKKYKKCPKCGKQVNEVRNHCPHCKHDFTNKPKTQNKHNKDKFDLKDTNYQAQEKRKQTLIKIGNEKRREYSNSNSKPCPHCGKSINKNNNVCFSCGHDFKKEKGFLRKLFSSKTKLCPACNEMNEEHFNYCKRCGYNFNTGSFGISDNTKSDMRKCSKCGALNSKDSNFCTECGKKLRN